MADVNVLKVTPVVYDFTLFWECAQKDWKNKSAKLNIKGDGSLVNALDWASTYSFDPNDSGGATKFGVTESTWQSFVKAHPNKGYSPNLNSLRKDSWFEVVKWFWEDLSSCGYCANYACGFIMLQMRWMGFGQDSQKNLLATLKANADKKDYNFISKGSNYRRIADATHAYTNPMIAYNYMVNTYIKYLYNLSSPGNKNHTYRCGWMNRIALGFPPDGLYVCVRASGESVGLNKSSNMQSWISTALNFSKNKQKGYVKLLDWGASPEEIAQMQNIAYDFSQNDSESGSSYYYSSGSYGGCGGVYQLGNYSNAPDAQIIPQQIQNRDEVLQTLINGSYTPDAVKKCEELITVEKKKNVKIKSET